MSQHAMNTIATLIPALRYRNASAAIEWLCRAFGFKQQLVVPGKNNTIAHAQLTFGKGHDHARICGRFRVRSAVETAG